MKEMKYKIIDDQGFPPDRWNESTFTNFFRGTIFAKSPIDAMKKASYDYRHIISSHTKGDGVHHVSARLDEKGIVCWAVTVIEMEDPPEAY